jgi:RNA polymerase sigma factor (sigma-70 family)
MSGTEIDRLLLDARAGCSLALGQLLETAHGDLLSAATGVLGRQTRSRISADEVFADALVAVVHDIRSLRATSYTGFRYWFASIARNQLRHALRRRRTQREYAMEDVEPESGDPPPLAPQAESQDFFRDALVRMPRTQQVAYVLREGLGLTWRSIGFVIGRRAPGAARLLHYRASVRARGAACARPDLRPLVPAIRA